MSAYTNKIESIELSNCPELTDLALSDNALSSIELSASTKKNVSMDMNQILSIDVAMLPDLERLNLTSNAIAELDVTRNPGLLVLNVAKNKFESLDIRNCPEINTLYCTSNRLTELDISTCSESTLVSFYCIENPKLKTVWVWPDWTGIPSGGFADWYVDDSIDFKIKE